MNEPTLFTPWTAFIHFYFNDLQHNITFYLQKTKNCDFQNKYLSFHPRYFRAFPAIESSTFYLLMPNNFPQEPLMRKRDNWCTNYNATIKFYNFQRGSVATIDVQMRWYLHWYCEIWGGEIVLQTFTIDVTIFSFQYKRGKGFIL